MRLLNKNTEVALNVLEILYSFPHQTFSSAELSQRLGKSTGYVSHILNKLKHMRLVLARKGPGGGYRISSETGQSNLKDLMAGFICSYKKDADVVVITAGDAAQALLQDTLHNTILAAIL